MISLSLKQTALAVAADPKWVLSAFARLGVPRQTPAYSDDRARWLRLARLFHRELGIPLPSAGVLATDALLKFRGASKSDMEVEAQSRAQSRAQLRAQSRAQAPSSESDEPASSVASAPRERHTTVLRGSRADGIALVIDLERFESTFQVALASALAFGAPRRPGRKPRAPAHLGAALAQARRKGIDLQHVRAKMRHPLETRLGGRLPYELVGRVGNPDGTAGRIRALLHEIRSSGVRGVLVGELAEVVRGAGLAMPDPAVELCWERSPENRRRATQLIRRIGTRIGGAPRPVDEVTLAGVEVVPVPTQLGRLVLRATVPGVHDYAEVESRADKVDVFDINLPVVDIALLRQARAAAGTFADMARLPLLDTIIAVPLVEGRQRDAAARR